MKKVTILIPCYNEEKGIGKVIQTIPYERLEKLGFQTEVLVVNNNSSDNTAEIAKSLGAIVIDEPKQGKGNAIKKGFYSISSDTDFVIMLDGDNTYKSKEIPRLLEPLENNFCDVIVGSRLGGKLNKGSLKFQNRVANWGYTFLVRTAYRANVTDVLSGFFAWKKGVIDILTPCLESEGFAIEMEMITKMVKLGYSLYSMPITYDQRDGESKLDSYKDGARIVVMFFRNLKWKPNGESINIYPIPATQNYSESIK